MLTFGEFRTIVAPYVGRSGKCADTPEAASFAIDIMRDLLINGAHAGVRKLCIQSHRGCMSMPPEVEMVLKARIDRRNANLWSKWFSFHSSDDSWGFDGQYPPGCFPAGQILVEDGTDSPLAYEVPEGGSLLAVIGNCDEGDATIIVNGRDITGRPITTYFEGEQIAGEKFRIKKLNRRVGSVPFGTVTSVIKPKTNGYLSLEAYNPETGEAKFLADYAPSELTPMYRRFRVISDQCGKCDVVNLSLLCRVKLKDSYLDNELTLFENKNIVQLAAQRVQAERNNDIQTAAYKEGATAKELDKEAGYKKMSGQPVSVFFPTSGGAIKNLGGLGSWRFPRGGNFGS